MRKRSFQAGSLKVPGGLAIFPSSPHPRPSLPRRSCYKAGPCGCPFAPAGSLAAQLARSAQGLRLPLAPGALSHSQAPQPQPIPHGSWRTPGLSTPEKGGLPSDYLASKYLPEFLQLLPMDTGSVAGIIVVLGFLFLPCPLRHLTQEALGASVHPETRPKVTGLRSASPQPCDSIVLPSMDLIFLL